MLYYDAQFSTRWLGVPIGKLPLDTWVYQAGWSRWTSRSSRACLCTHASLI
jgi:hypothetical protein